MGQGLLCWRPWKRRKTFSEGLGPREKTGGDGLGELKIHNYEACDPDPRVGPSVGGTPGVPHKGAGAWRRLSLGASRLLSCAQSCHAIVLAGKAGPARGGAGGAGAARGRRRRRRRPWRWELLSPLGPGRAGVRET